MAALDEEYIAKMKDILEVYERPYNRQEPVICVDEKPITLHADLRPPRRQFQDEKRDWITHRNVAEPQCFLGCRTESGPPFSPSRHRIARVSSSLGLR